MATRYYTEEAYEQIKRTIEEIDNTEVNPVIDFFGDLFLRIGQFLEIYKVDDYQDDLQKWYNKVLDSHNTTLSKVDSIFNDVETVDFDHRDLMDGVLTSILDFQNTLNALRDVISGKSSLAEGQKAATGYLTSGKNALNNSYNKLLTQMEQRTLWDASLAVAGDAIKLGGLLIKCKAGGNVADYKNLADTALATACDLRAMLSFADIIVVGVSGWALGMDYEDYLDYRFKQLTKAQKYKDTDSISDLLGNLAEGMDEQVAACPKDSAMYPVLNVLTDGAHFASDTSEVVDIVADAYGIGKDLKDMHDNIDMWRNGKAYTEQEYAKIYDVLKDKEILDLSKDGPDWIYRVKVSPGEFVKTVVSDRSGLPLTNWDDPSKRAGNVWKTAGTIWAYGEKLIPDTDGYTKANEIPDVAFDKLKDTKFLKDVFDFARDLDEFAHSNPFSNTADSGTIDTMGNEHISLPNAAGALPIGPRGGIGEMGGR